MDKKKKTIAIIVGVLFAAVVILIAVLTPNNGNKEDGGSSREKDSESSERAEEETPINNDNDFITIDEVQSIRELEVKDYEKVIGSAAPINDEVKDKIKVNLYNMIVKNFSGRNFKNDELRIRESSFNDIYDASVDVHLSTFIVDIPEIKQSYQVNYMWSSTPNNYYVNNPISVDCLAQNKLVYGYFNCKDMNTP